MLSACSSNTKIQSQANEYQIVTMPYSLMRDVCDAHSAGSTVGTLVDAYNHNTSCVYKFKAQVKEQITWTENTHSKKEAQ